MVNTGRGRHSGNASRPDRHPKEVLTAEDESVQREMQKRDRQSSGPGQPVDFQQRPPQLNSAARAGCSSRHQERRSLNVHRMTRVKPAAPSPCWHPHTKARPRSPTETGWPMATSTDSMALDVQQYRLNAIAERRAGNTLEAQAWDAEADALEARIITLEQHHGA